MELNPAKHADRPRAAGRGREPAAKRRDARVVDGAVREVQAPKRRAPNRRAAKGGARPEPHVVIAQVHPRDGHEGPERVPQRRPADVTDVVRPEVEPAKLARGPLAAAGASRLRG